MATGEAIDAAADKALADAKADTAQHVAQVKQDIHDANEQIAANKTAVETEARLRAEGDKLAQDAAAAVKAETDRLSTKYNEMDTSVTNVKNDLKNVMTSTTQLEQDMIVSTLIEYAVGDSDTVPPDLATYWTGEPNNSVSVLSDPWSPDTPERTPGTYIWMRTRVTFGDGGQETSAPVLVTGNTGAQGPQGVPGEPGEDGLPGAAGTNGQTSYLHLAYANSADGRTDFSTSDSNRDYIGQYTDFTQADSSDPSKYTWSKIKGATGAQGLKGDPGATGLPGAPGADGRTSYAHFAYANSADGRTDFSTTNGANKKYLGQYVDFVEADSTDPTKYTWSLIVGPQGPQGPQGVAGAKGDKGEDGVTRYSYFAYGTSASGANFVYRRVCDHCGDAADRPDEIHMEFDQGRDRPCWPARRRRRQGRCRRGRQDLLHLFRLWYERVRREFLADADRVQHVYGCVHHTRRDAADHAGELYMEPDQRQSGCDRRARRIRIRSDAVLAAR